MFQNYQLTDKADTFNSFSAQCLQFISSCIGNDVFEAGHQAVIVLHKITLHSVSNRRDSSHYLFEHKLRTTFHQLSRNKYNILSILKHKKIMLF